MLLPQLDQLSRHVFHVSVALSDAPFGSFAQVQWQKKGTDLWESARGSSDRGQSMRPR